MTMPVPRSAYIHVPFCRHRCGYCNFTVIAGRDDLHASYLQALQMELETLGAPQEMETVFLGGGTPTQLHPEELRQLFDLIAYWFPMVTDGEYTIEANPEDIDEESVALFQEYGVNRVSLGGQSFDMDKLTLLERSHQPSQLEQCFTLLKPIPSVSMDLIFGVPGETLSQWSADLDALLIFLPTHISTYGLTIEKGTSFWSRFERGELLEVDEELQRQFYIEARQRLSAAGYHHYEVSNFAKPGFECRHNQAYWFGDPYFAVGPGAASFVNGYREVNHRSTTTYISKVLAGESAVAESELVSGEELHREVLVFALRRLDGINPDWFFQKTGVTIESLAGDQITKFVNQGLLRWQDGRLCLTEEGLLVSDSLWPYLL